MTVDLLHTRLPEATRAHADHLPDGLPLPSRCPGMSHALDWAIPGVIAICKEAEHRGCVWKVVLRRGVARASLVAEWSHTARALAEELIARNRAEAMATRGWTKEVDRLRAELVAARVIAAGQVASAGACESDAGFVPAPHRPVQRGTRRAARRLLVAHPDDQSGRVAEFDALAGVLDPRDGTLARALKVSQWLITGIMDNGRPVSTDIAQRVHALLCARLQTGCATNVPDLS